jgi:hypothetical protein
MLRRASGNSPPPPPGEYGDGDSQQQQQSSLFLNLPRPGGGGRGPAAEELLHSQPPPSMIGHLFKKDNSFWSWFCPYLFPVWKERFFILIGSFLFRYATEFDDSTKGVPIPIDQSTISIDKDDATCFTLSTLRKDYKMKCRTRDECKEWVRALRERKAEAIREKMGHVPSSSDTKAWNKAGSKLFSEKLKREEEEGRMRSMMGAGVPNQNFNPINYSSS